MCTEKTDLESQRESATPQPVGAESTVTPRETMSWRPTADRDAAARVTAMRRPVWTRRQLPSGGGSDLGTDPEANSSADGELIATGVDFRGGAVFMDGLHTFVARNGPASRQAGGRLPCQIYVRVLCVAGRAVLGRVFRSRPALPSIGLPGCSDNFAWRCAFRGGLGGRYAVFLDNLGRSFRHGVWTCHIVAESWC